MYKKSGGCTAMKRCADCIHLKRAAWSKGFGKTAKKEFEILECGKHPNEEGRKHWKGTYTACRYYEEANIKTVFNETADGQLSFF